MTNRDNRAPEVRIGSAIVEVDLTTTRRAHSEIDLDAPESCACAYCRNFIAARSQVYSPPVVALLETLGIAPAKEAEIWQCNRLPSGLHRYGGMLHFSGRLIAGGERIVEIPSGGQSYIHDYQDVTDRFAATVSSHASLIEPSFDGVPVLQLNFIALLPWVIPDIEPS